METTGGDPNAAAIPMSRVREELEVVVGENLTREGFRKGSWKTKGSPWGALMVFTREFVVRGGFMESAAGRRDTVNTRVSCGLEGFLSMRNVGGGERELRAALEAHIAEPPPTPAESTVEPGIVEAERTASSPLLLLLGMRERGAVLSLLLLLLLP